MKASVASKGLSSGDNPLGTFFKELILILGLILSVVDLGERLSHVNNSDSDSPFPAFNYCLFRDVD